MDTKFHTTQMSRIILEKIVNESKYEFSRFDIDKGNFKVDTILSEISQNYITLLKHEVYGQKDVHEYKVDTEIPKNWWEHFKLNKMPKWFIKKYPVKYDIITKSITFNHTALFPNIPVTDNPHCIEVAINSEIKVNDDNFYPSK